MINTMLLHLESDYISRLFFHWNLHSPSFIRETNPEQLEHNGDQTIFSYVFAFLDNNIKPTQIFDNNITPFAWLHCPCNQSSQCVLAKTTCSDFTKKMAYTVY